jgi:hypothetical protein
MGLCTAGPAGRFAEVQAVAMSRPVQRNARSDHPVQYLNRPRALQPCCRCARQSRRRVRLRGLDGRHPERRRHRRPRRARATASRAGNGVLGCEAFAPLVAGAATLELSVQLSNSHFIVIARSEATKQSRMLPRRQSGLLRFARNDGGDTGSHSRGANLARVMHRRCPLEIGGRRECRVQAAPMARLQQKSRRQSPQVQPEHPAFPAQWLYGL